MTACSTSRKRLVRRGDPLPTYHISEIVKDLHQDDVEKDAQVRERLSNEGGTATLHLRRRKPDGTWRHTLAQFNSGRRLPVRQVRNHRPVTEHHRAG